MICAQCGNDVAEGSPACPRCGAQMAQMAAGQAAGVPAAAGMGPAAGLGPAAGGPAAGPAGPPVYGGPAPAGPAWSPPASAAPAFNLDMRRLTRVDRIVGGATVVFFISLFLPWFTSSADGISGSVDGLWHGYMYIALILALAVIAYLVVRAGFGETPFRLPLEHEQVLLAATAVIFVLTVISFVFKPSGYGLVSIGWGFGAFIGLIAAIVAVAPIGLPFVRSRTGR
jgi:hypothetical protein